MTGSDNAALDGAAAIDRDGEARGMDLAAFANDGDLNRFSRTGRQDTSLRGSAPNPLPGEKWTDG